MLKCLITGCTFVDKVHGRSAHGDLHEMGDCYIFNAVLSEGETNWQYSASLSGLDDLFAEKKTIFTDCDYFERRGVIVVEKFATYLNDFATNYLKPSHAKA